MKKIIINEYNLRAQDLDYEVIRVKGLIVNSQNQILMEFNNNTYQFPGGHLNENEKLEEALLREIREETGITIKELDGPFMQIVTYDKNYLSSSIWSDTTDTSNWTSYNVGISKTTEVDSSAIGGKIIKITISTKSIDYYQ